MYWGLAYRDLTLQQVRPLEVGRSEGGRDQIRRETGQRRRRTVQRIGGFRGVGGLLPLSRTEVPMRQTVHTQILPQAHQRTRKASGGRAKSREQASQSGPVPNTLPDCNHCRRRCTGCPAPRPSPARPLL